MHARIYPRNESGITLIELMVVMSIIAILTVGIWGNFFNSLNKSRDSRRKQDLQSVSKALDLYYYDNKAYPTGVGNYGLSWGSAFDNANHTVIYMSKLPKDPASGYDYCYSSTDGSYYQLYANLENQNDQQLISGLCNGGSYNYGISSPNVTP